ncbi:serine/threonine protein kinase, CMGC family, CDC2/CDK subfamily [Teratosphaeria destructans]|uniref:cyclin-dependent kinase n=1 Tax=Teratosphaeria destructans TaxID=418781 RepID=A0A9W7SSU7_9PEZI|nr:serine/threonine protein kinase, CMGC family, CDC2/CDK subfamily [Teratosphaeria destructans]
MVSRWADSAEDAAEDARRRAEKEEKRRVRAERQRKAEEEAASTNGHTTPDDVYEPHRPAKRRRTTTTTTTTSDTPPDTTPDTTPPLLRFQPPTWQPSRSIARFHRLNHIQEGSYGSVARARHLPTGDVVALKQLKLHPHRDAGFPVTALREIQCLTAARHHRHVVHLREVVCGEGPSRDNVYLVMDFLEHDLKTLQEEIMDEPFLPSETKTLLLQLASALDFLHDHWILHRDLKTSNILLNNRGEIKLADFGMARFVGSPPPSNLTQLVVTLWYRAPELLLGAKQYDAAIDLWSLGCVFGELVAKTPLLQGKNEVDQLGKIFTLCGIPATAMWPDFPSLPNARTLRLPPPSTQSSSSHIRTRFPTLTHAGASLLDSLLALNPAHRPTARAMLDHPYFHEHPRPKPTAMFPTFPSKAGQEKRGRARSPDAPIRGAAPDLGAGGEVDFGGLFTGREEEAVGGGFQLKVV